MMNVEKTTLGIQTCSVSVSNETHFDSWTDLATSVSEDTPGCSLSSQLVTVTWRGPSVHHVILKLGSVSVELVSLGSSVMNVHLATTLSSRRARSATPAPPSGPKMSATSSKPLRR